MTPEQRITKAKVNLLINEPFFGQLACYLNLVEVTGNKLKIIQTAAINERGDLFYSPEFIKKLSDSELKGLVCHEILHLAFQHPWRLQSRNPILWNIAADLKVNEAVPTHSGISLPQGGLIPNYGSWSAGKIKVEEIEEKTTEQIYDELYKQVPHFSVIVNQDGSITCDTSGLPKQWKDIIDQLVKDLITSSKGKDNKLTQGQRDSLLREWQERVSSAQRTQGSVPAGLQRELDALENPELPWHQIVRQRFSRIRNVRTWKRPNKKRLPWYFPGVKKNKTVKAIIAIDTSGSMDRKDITKAISEIWGLSRAFKHFHFFIVWSDAAVWGDPIEVTNKNREQIKKLKPLGGGGTDFRPVFDLVKKKWGNQIDCLVFFTDGYGDFPTKRFPYQVYWVTNTSGIKWPFGKVIKMKY